MTFDDLPAGSAVAEDLGSLRQLTKRLLESVRKHGVPAVGFVNEGKLFARDAGPSEVEGRTALLRMWLDAGLELGNHSYSHGDLNRMSLDEFQADVIRGEAVTRKLLAEKGGKLRYFRHPFLHVGDKLPKRRAFEEFLAAHGYTVAPVTVDNDEYVYAAVYADARRRGDAAAAGRIGEDYLRYMDEVFSKTWRAGRPAARSSMCSCCTRIRSTRTGSTRWPKRSCAAATASSRWPRRSRTTCTVCPTRSSGHRATRG